MEHYMPLTDEQWAKLEPLIPPTKSITATLPRRYRLVTAITQVNQSLTAEHQSTLLTHRTDLLSDLTFPTRAYLNSQPFDMPELPHTDSLSFTQ
jgi:hypothetical protein